MRWIVEYKRVWRVAILGLFVAAVVGPWVFDRINVPAQYACDYRLEGDFCGIPMSGVWILAAWGGVLIQWVAGIAAGSLPLANLGGALLFILGVLLFLLPFFTTLGLVLRGDRPSRPVLRLGAWALAAIPVGLLIHSMPNWPQPALWGIWLFIALAPLALILEALAQIFTPRFPQTLLD